MWAMPSHETFSIKPIKELLNRYCMEGMNIVDPFARNNTVANITNDLDLDTDAIFHLDANVFLSKLQSNYFDILLFDPPYSTRQLVEVYKKRELSVTTQTTKTDYWTRMKKSATRIVKPGGHVISFGWNTVGMGKKNGFIQLEILIVSHGGMRNDTLVTVEKKIKL